MSDFSAFADSLTVTEEQEKQQEEQQQASAVAVVEDQETKDMNTFVEQMTTPTPSSEEVVEVLPKVEPKTDASKFLVPELKGIKTTSSTSKSYPPVSNQTVVAGSDPRVRRKNGHQDALIIKKYEDISTLYDSFKKCVEKFGERPCLGARKRDPTDPSKLLMEYEFITYKQVDDISRNLACGLRHLGLEPNQHIAIYSKNRKEWQIAAEACNKQSLVSLALYDTLGEDSSNYILNHGEVVAICGSGETLASIIKLAPKAEFLKLVVCFDAISAEQKSSLEQMKIKALTLDEVVELGKQNPVEDVPPTPQSIACLNYTSGTTGMPKGVVITHLNLIAASAGISHNIIDLNETDCVISYLPLAHILERLVEIVFMQAGTSIGFWEGNIKNLKDDLFALKPTAFPAVPRVLDKLFDGIKDKIAKESKLKQWAINKAIKSKEEGMLSGKSTPISDVILGVIRKNFGGRIRFCLSGGAPIRPEVQQFMRVIFGCCLVQGYGLTETCAASLIQLPYDYSEGHIGCVVPSTEVKLDDVPEMNYSMESNKSGEICVRGPSVAMGYYKDEEKTKESWDSEGWFHTGDIARLQDNGTFTIIDRKKNIFKLSQGEYIAAENIEQKLCQSKFVSGIWVYGDSFKSCVIGVAVANIPVLQQYAREHGKEQLAEKIEDLCEDADIVKAVLADIVSVAKQAKLKGFEIIRGLKLLPREFETYGVTTPTMKIVRPKMKEVFQQDIDKLYQSIPDV